MGHLKIKNMTGQKIAICNHKASYVIEVGRTKDIPIQYDHNFGRVKEQKLLVGWHKKPYPLKED